MHLGLMFILFVFRDFISSDPNFNPHIEFFNHEKIQSVTQTELAGNYPTISPYDYMQNLQHRKVLRESFKFIQAGENTVNVSEYKNL